MKNKFILIIVLLFLFFSVTVVSAHPGRTDSDGGHYDQSTGTYHYHHGYPAHQHNNDKCPYDFIDLTNSFSGSTDTIEDPDDSFVDSTDDIEYPDDSFSSDTNLIKSSSKKISLTFGRVIELIFCSFWGLYLLYMVFSIAKILLEELFDKIKECFKRKKRLISPPVSAPEIEPQNQQDYYFKLYANIDPIDCCNIPRRCCIKDGLPSSRDPGRYGIYTVYISDHDNFYHIDNRCRNYYTYSANLYNVRDHYSPCPDCINNSSPDLSWYDEYLRIVSIKQRYNIP